MCNKYVSAGIMSVRNCLLVVCFTEKRKSNFFLCCQEKFAFQNVSFHQLIIEDFCVKLFLHKGFHNENLSFPCSIIICSISIWPRRIPTVTTLSRRSCFRRRKCTFFYSCFSQTQQVHSCECGVGAHCEKHVLLETAETSSSSQRVRAEKGGCLCSTRSTGRLQRWSSLLLGRAQVQPLFWQSFLTEVLLRLTWSSSPLEEKILPFSFPGNILFSLTQEEMENCIPYHYPLAEEESRKYSCP